MLGDRCWATDAGRPMLGDRCWATDAGRPMLGDRCWATDAGRPMLGDRCWATDAGRPRLGDRCWATDAGRPMLGDRCWATDAGRPMLGDLRPYVGGAIMLRRAVPPGRGSARDGMEVTMSAAEIERALAPGNRIRPEWFRLPSRTWLRSTHCSYSMRSMAA